MLSVRHIYGNSVKENDIRAVNPNWMLGVNVLAQVRVNKLFDIISANTVPVFGMPGVKSYGRGVGQR